MRSGSSPPTRIASAMVTPPLSSYRSRSSGVSSPASARLPIMPKEKRAPSSSVKTTTSTGRSVSVPCSCNVCKTSMPPSTPRGPSKSPPLYTESACEPTRTAGASGSLPSPTDQVGGGDLADREAGLFHVGGHPVFGGPHLVGEGEPGHAAALLPAYLAELGDPAPQPLAVYHVVLLSSPRAQSGRASSRAPSRRSGSRPCAVMPSRPVMVPAASRAFSIASSVASAAA